MQLVNFKDLNKIIRSELSYLQFKRDEALDKKYPKQASK
jgi:hypothetical protein